MATTEEEILSFKLMKAKIAEMSKHLWDIVQTSSFEITHDTLHELSNMMYIEFPKWSEDLEGLTEPMMLNYVNDALDTAFDFLIPEQHYIRLDIYEYGLELIIRSSTTLKDDGYGHKIPKQLYSKEYGNIYSDLVNLVDIKNFQILPHHWKCIILWYISIDWKGQ